MKQCYPGQHIFSGPNCRSWRLNSIFSGLLFVAISGAIGAGDSQTFGPLVAPAAAQEQAFVSIERARGLPIRGQSRDSVRNKFGEPAARKGAVGNPPISSWVYAEFTVYFEYDRVITTVAEQDSLPMSLGNIQ